MRAAFILSVLMLSAAAWGQKEPRQKAWEQAMRDLSAALAGEDSAVVVRAVEGVPLKGFGSVRRAQMVDLFDLCSGAVPISTRAYETAPTSAASDLAADFAASDLPEAVKQKFATSDAKSADATAAQWISDALASEDGASIGVLVFWRGNRSLPSLADSHTRHVIFVLVAGDIDADGKPHFRRIAFGNPLRAGN
jgi:hypothetical protein